MIKINIICIGKIKEKYFTDAIAEYAKRLTAFPVRLRFHQTVNITNNLRSYYGA